MRSSNIGEGLAGPQDLLVPAEPDGAFVRQCMLARRTHANYTEGRRHYPHVP